MKLLKNLNIEDRHLLKDNITLLSTTMVLHILGFLFHFYSSRKLGPVDYGVFGGLLSLVYLITVPFNTIQTSISNFVARFSVKKEEGKIHYLVKASLKKLTIYGILGVFGFFVFIPFLANFLHVGKMPLFVLSFFILFALLLPVIRGVLQGTQQFKHLGFNLMLEGIVKLVGGILLVSWGWGVGGAVGAFVLAYAIPLAFGFFPLKNIFKEPKQSFETKEVYKYSFPVILMLLSLTAFYSLDVILVKHFIDSVQAGYYAALSLLGKTIFFASFSIVQVMFPKVVSLHAEKKPTKHVFYKSFLLVLLICASAVALFSIFPSFFVKLFFGNAYMMITNYLVPFSLFISSLSLVAVLSFYQVSLSKKKFIFLLFFFNILEIVLLSIFHSSLLQVIYILLYLLLSLCALLFLYTVFSHETNYHHPGKE